MLANENQNKLGTIIVVEGEVTAEKASLVQELQQKVKLEFVSHSLDAANESLEARRDRLVEVEGNIDLYTSQVGHLKGRRAQLENSKIDLEDKIDLAQKDLLAIKSEIKLRIETNRNSDSKDNQNQNKLRRSARQEEVSKVIKSKKVNMTGSFLEDVANHSYHLRPVSYIQKAISAEPESMLGHRAIECKRKINELRVTLEAVRAEIGEVQSRIELKIGALEGLKRYKEIIEQQVSEQSAKVAVKSKAQEGIVDFATRRGVVHKEVTSFAELAVTDKRQNYILFSNGLTHEQISGMLGNRYFIEKFEPQVEA